LLVAKVKANKIIAKFLHCKCVDLNIISVKNQILSSYLFVLDGLVAFSYHKVSSCLVQLGVIVICWRSEKSSSWQPGWTPARSHESWQTSFLPIHGLEPRAKGNAEDKPAACLNHLSQQRVLRFGWCVHPIHNGQSGHVNKEGGRYLGSLSTKELHSFGQNSLPPW